MRAIWIRQASCSTRVRMAAVAAATAVFAVGVGASEARPVRGDQVTLDLILNVNKQPAYAVLIPNFERVYPNISVDPTYGDATTVSQLETIELAAGSAPELITTEPGCGQGDSVCAFAQAGDLAPIINAPWVRWSMPLATSMDKYGAGLFSFTPTVSPYGVFTNDTLFKRLGLKIPQTLPRLLTLCQQAKADGTVAFDWGGSTASSVSSLISDLAVASLYGQDPRWAGELRAGTVSFDGTSGWHQALQTFVDLSNAGCFQPGTTGTTSTAAIAQFAQGQALMMPSLSINEGQIDALSPQFALSFHPFPDGEPTQTRSYIQISDSLGVNEHASAQEQSAAQTFIDFLARPKQDALYAQTTGGLTQYQLLHLQIPSFMSNFAPVFQQHKYVVNPSENWWNPNVLLALQQDTIGLITGQETIDDVLQAMDAAWKQGPQ